MNKEYLVNGPVNVIRLVKGDKSIYIYGDIHKDIYHQDVCDPVNSEKESIDIDKLIIKIIKKYPQFKFNVYLEADDMTFIEQTLNINSKYIEQIRKLKKYKFNNLNSSIVDNRFEILDKNEQLINYIYDDSAFPQSYFPIDYNIIREILSFLSQQQIIINLILKRIGKKSIYKEHSKTIEALNELTSSTVSSITDVINRMKTSYIPFHEAQGLTIMFCTYCFNIKYILQIVFASVQDTNMILLLEDADSVEKNVYYCGLYHMVNTSHVLVNKYGYQISHILHGNVEELNEGLKQLPIKYDVETYQRLRTLFKMDKTYNQCVNLESFPDDLI